MTVKLVNVTEAQALETILRSVAGYMAAPRNGATTGPSIYDRILVMATSSAPAPPANAARPSPAQPNAFAGTQRFVPPRQRPEQAEQEEIEEPDENPPSPPVFTFPQPPQNNGYPQQPGTYTPGSVAQPGMIVPAPQTITINPAQGYPAPQPQMPVGVAQPGMMVPAPPTRQPTQPTQPGTDPPAWRRQLSSPVQLSFPRSSIRTWRISNASHLTIDAASSSFTGERLATKPLIACGCIGTGRAAIPPTASSRRTG